MQNLSNEKLCVKAQKGDATAVELLLENNMGFIRRTAHEVYEAMNLNGSGLGIDFDDLVQEGSIGLLKTIPHFEPDREMKFLTYAGKAVKNAMTDLVRQAFSQYEQRVTSSEEQYPLKRVYLDDIVFGDEMSAELTVTPFEMKDEATGRTISGKTYGVRSVDENGEIYECKIKPFRQSDKALLEMLLR